MPNIDWAHDGEKIIHTGSPDLREGVWAFIRKVLDECLAEIREGSSHGPRINPQIDDDLFHQMDLLVRRVLSETVLPIKSVALVQDPRCPGALRVTGVVMNKGEEPPAWVYGGLEIQ